MNKVLKAIKPIPINLRIQLANPGVYDLLKLTNGLDTLLGSVSLPSVTISQLRLKLGRNNTVKLNGQI